MMNPDPMTRPNRNRHPRSFTNLSSLPMDMDRLIDRVFSGLTGEGTADRGDLRLEVSETEAQVRVRVEAPGVAPADLDISLNDGVLTISGKKHAVEREEGETQHYSERRYGAFRRSLKIEAPIDLEQVKATHAHGVVTIELPKVEAAKPKRISIQES